jgi:hypothetical protein
LIEAERERPSAVGSERFGCVGLPATRRAAVPPRGVRYERELALAADGELLLIEHDELLAF